MEYASSTSINVSRNGPPSWNRCRSGNAVDTSRRMAANHSRIRRLLSPTSASGRARTALARWRAFLYVSSVSASSLPMARCQTAPRKRGVTPRHHSSRVRCSDTARSQSGYTYSSQMRWRVSRVLSLSHWAAAARAALRFSASRQHVISKR